MATNQITIVLEDCEPIGGYYVFYRPIGNVDPHRFAGIFFTSPIIFTDELDPVNQQYEGYVQSHCGGGIFGDPIPWETEGSPSVPGGGSEPEPEECCDPVVLTADTETTIPDGSLPGSGSEPEVCCTPVILNACIETLDESGSGSISGSESGSGSEPEPELALRLLFDDIANADTLVGDASDVADWNTFFDTASFADTPFTSVTVVGDEVFLYGATELQIINELFRDNLNLLRVLDEAGSIIETMNDFTFRGCTNLTEVSMPNAASLGNGSFFNCPLLVNIDFPSCTTIDDAVFLICTSLTDADFPAATTIGESAFNGCSGLTSCNFPLVNSAGNSAFVSCSSLTTLNLPSLITAGPSLMASCNALTTIGLPVCSDLGSTAFIDSVFDTIAGNTITLTILTATATDGDVGELEANNTVTLILV